MFEPSIVIADDDHVKMSGDAADDQIPSSSCSSSSSSPSADGPAPAANARSALFPSAAAVLRDWGFFKFWAEGTVKAFDEQEAAKPEVERRRMTMRELIALYLQFFVNREIRPSRARNHRHISRKRARVLDNETNQDGVSQPSHAANVGRAD